MIDSECGGGCRFIQHDEGRAIGLNLRCQKPKYTILPGITVWIISILHEKPHPKGRIMRKAIIVLMVMAIAGTALAQVDPDVNSIGIYFDQGATINCTTAPLFTLFTSYLCATNISEPSGIFGWECSVECGPPGNFLELAWTPRGLYVNVLTPPNFVVGLGQPLPWVPSIVLMDISIMALSYDPIYFTLHPTIPSSFYPPSPGYAAGDDPGNLIPLDYSVGSEDVCAIINGDCYVVGNEEMSWGGVKALYR